MVDIIKLLSSIKVGLANKEKAKEHTRTITEEFQSLQLPIKSVTQNYTGEPFSPFFLHSDESPKSHNELIDKIQETAFSSNEGHIGIGNVWMNLKILAASRQSFGILADGYGPQLELYDETLSALKRAETKEGFLKEAKTIACQHYVNLRPDKLDEYLKEIEEDFIPPNGILSDNDNFIHIRDLARSGNLISLYVDLFDKDRVDDLARYLTKANRTVGTIYLTNLTWFMREDSDFYHPTDHNLTENDVEKFWANIQSLCSDKTLICDAQHSVDEQILDRNGHSFIDSRHYVGCGNYDQRRQAHMIMRAKYATLGRL